MKWMLKLVVWCLVGNGALAQDDWRWDCSWQEEPTDLQCIISRLEARHRMIFLNAEGPNEEEQLRFRILRPITRDDARRIIVDCLQEFQRVQCLLQAQQQPLISQPNNITISLDVYEQQGLPAIAPSLGHVEGSCESITYGYRDCAYDVACTHVEKEAYQEGRSRSAREDLNLGISRMPL